MSMLAEKRTKKKWCLNPNGKDWSNDDNKFGQRMLEKMGWKKGCGLGVNLQGMKEHVKVSAKNDNKGLGCSNTADELVHHQENFENVLSELQSTLSEGSSTPVANTLPVSLEEKSKKSRARVHYQKFTRGKDVSRYSARDMAGIFGKKTKSRDDKTSGMGMYEDHNINNSPTAPGCKSASFGYPEYSKSIAEKPFVFGSNLCEGENGGADESVKYGYQKDKINTCIEDIENRSEKQTLAQKIKSRISQVVDITDSLRHGGEHTIAVSPRTKLGISREEEITPVEEDYAEIAKTNILSSEIFFLAKKYYTVCTNEPKKKSVEVVDLTGDLKSAVKQSNGISQKAKLDLYEKKKKSIETVDLADDLRSGVEETFAISHRSKSDKKSFRKKVKDIAVLENYEKNALKTDISNREIHVGAKSCYNWDIGEEEYECVIIEEQNGFVEDSLHKKTKKEKNKKGKQEKAVQINIKRKVQLCDEDQLEENCNCAEIILDADVTQCEDFNGKVEISPHKKIKKKKTESWKKQEDIQLKVNQVEDEIVEGFKAFHISKKNNFDVEVTHSTKSVDTDHFNEHNEGVSKPKRKKLSQIKESAHIEFKAEDPEKTVRKPKKMKKCASSFSGTSALEGTVPLSTEPFSQHEISKENKDNATKSTQNKLFTPTKPVLSTKVECNVVKDKKLPKKEDRSLKDAVQLLPIYCCSGKESPGTPDPQKQEYLKNKVQKKK